MALRKVLASFAMGLLISISSVNSAANAAIINIGFSQIGKESSWRIVLSEDIIRSAKDHNINLKFENAESSQQHQIESIRGFIKDNVDLIGFVPIVETGWDEVLREAKKAKIPVIILDRDLKVSDPSLYLTKIGSDSYTEGSKAFTFIDDYVVGHAFQPKYGRHQINIAIIEGTESASVTAGRRAGFYDSMSETKTSRQYNVFTVEQGDFSRESGKAAMLRILEKHKDDIDVLFAMNDDMALGAIEAMEEAGVKTGKDVLVVSIDATKEMLKKIIAEKANATIECNPLQGDLFFDIALKVLKGEFVPRSIFVEESIFTKANANALIDFRKYVNGQK